jgi:hypothetical protein
MTAEIEQVKDAVLKEGIDTVVGYTKQFVDALTPIAKKAYDVGLVTLQIDAAASFVYAALSAISIALIVYFTIRLWKTSMKDDTLAEAAIGATVFGESLASYFLFAVRLICYQCGCGQN